MTFLQTSDWHLGKIFYEVSLIDDQRSFLTQILSELIRARTEGRPYDALIVPGDIYDRAVPPPEAVTLFSWFLSTAHAGFPDLEMFFLAGNHDSASRLSFAADLLESQHIHICTDTATFTVPVVVGAGDSAAAVYQLPYLTAGSVRPHSEREAAQNQPDLFAADTEPILRSQQQLAAAAVKQITAAHTSQYTGLPAVLCAHLFTRGALTSESEHSFAGETEQVDTSLFTPFAHTALGHLHRAQKCGSGSVWYSGSPLAYSFGENTDTYLLRVVVSGNGSSVEKLPGHPLHRVVCLDGSFEELYTGDPSDYRECYMEIRCTDTAQHENALALLRTKFPLLMSFTRKEPGEGAETASVAERRKLLESSRRDSGGIFDLFMHDMYGDLPPDPIVDRERALFIELAGGDHAA